MLRAPQPNSTNRAAEHSPDLATAGSSLSALLALTMALVYGLELTLFGG